MFDAIVPARVSHRQGSRARGRAGLTRVLLVVTIGLAVAALCPGSALAHAQLESTSPARGAVVAHPPALVSFTFDEAVGGTQGAVRVYDGRGDRVDDGDAVHPGGRGPTLGVGLRSGLRDGTYTATYRVISADTHVVTGGFVFSIGHPGGAGATVGALLAGQRTGAVTSDALTVAKALQYGSIGVGAGFLLFLSLVWLPVLTGNGGTREWVAASAAFAARVRRVLLVVAAAGLLSAVVAVALKGAEDSGVSFWSALSASVLKAAVQTRFGVVWGLAALGWLATGTLCAATLTPAAFGGLALRRASLGADGAALGRRAGLPAGLALAVPLAALLTVPALAGHASVQHPVWLFLPANLIHVGAMSVWLGGLVAMVAALPAATRALDPAERAPLLSSVLRRFSPLALLSVVALAATGTVQALLQIDAWSQLLHTAYGRAVLVKIGLLSGLAALGALNRRGTMPRLAFAAQRGEPTGAAGLTLRRTLRVEVAAIAAVLVVTGALSEYAPAKDASGGPPHVVTMIGPAQLSLDVDPGKPGSNEMHIYLLDPKSGAQYAKTKELTVTAEQPAKGIGPLTLQPELTGPGHYTIPSAVLGAPGDWRLHLTARVSDFDEFEKTVTVPIR